MKNEQDRHVKSDDELAWNRTLQKNAEICLRFLHNVGILPELRDSFKSSVYYNVEGLPLKDKIDNFERKEYFPFYCEQRLLMNNKDIWFNPLKKYGLMRELKHKYAVREVLFLIQLLAQHGMLQEAKGIVEEGTELKEKD